MPNNAPTGQAGVPGGPGTAPTVHGLAGVAPGGPGDAQPSTYVELFSDASMDPYGGDYEGIMRAFATNLQPEDGQVAEDLVDKVFSKAEVELQAYLMVTQHGEQNLVQVLHRPSTLRAPLGRDAPDQRFAFLGDTRGSQPPLMVLWPAGAFAQTNQLNVLSDTAIDVELASDANLEQLGPFPDDAAGVTTVKTRKIMYLPPKFVPIALGRVMTAREAWEEIGGAIRQETAQVQLDLAPLKNWLKTALTKFDQTTVPANHIASPSPPAIVFPEHQDHAAAILANDLPVGTGHSASIGGLSTLVGAVNQLTSEVVTTRTEEAARRNLSTAKTVDQHYGQAVDVLLRVCHSPTVGHLPSMYALIANSTKRNLRTNLEQHAMMVARELGLDQYAPIITPDLATKLSTAYFHHHDVDNLEEGVQPFITAPPCKTSWP